MRQGVVVHGEEPLCVEDDEARRTNGRADVRMLALQQVALRGDVRRERARADALALGRSLEVVQALLLLDGTKTLQEVRKAFRHHALLLEGLTRLVIDEADLASPGAQREHEGVASSIFRDGQSVRREGRDARRRCSQQRVGAHALALDGDLEERVDAVAVLVRDRGVVVTPADVPDDGVTPVVLRQKRPIVRR